jgi:hypothetical protein
MILDFKTTNCSSVFYFYPMFLNCKRYKYVSSFTMKLLEEGFDLCGHLLALRRYHFMELADWADSFIVSIHHKVILCNKFLY